MLLQVVHGKDHPMGGKIFIDGRTQVSELKGDAISLYTSGV